MGIYIQLGHCDTSAPSSTNAFKTRWCYFFRFGGNSLGQLKIKSNSVLNVSLSVRGRQPPK